MKTQKQKISLLVILIFVIAEKSTYAYIDAGSGSILFQLVATGIVSALVIFKIYWRKIVLIMSKKKVESDTNKSNDDLD